MRALNFARRNFKELIRDPISLVFVLLLPLFLLFIFQQFQIPSEAYELKNFTAGIIVFGFSFITLFTAVLVAKDRSVNIIKGVMNNSLESITVRSIIVFLVYAVIISIISIIIFKKKNISNNK